MNAVPSQSPVEANVLHLEYQTLREEVLKRIDARQQIISVALTIAGGFLGLGWGGGPVVLLLYPMLAVCLTAGWTHNELQIARLTRYIRDTLEKAIPGLGWETHLHKQTMGLLANALPIFLLGGIFPVTQILALILGLFRYTGNIVEIVLVYFDLVSLLAAVLMLEAVRRGNQK